MNKPSETASADRCYKNCYNFKAKEGALTLDCASKFYSMDAPSQASNICTNCLSWMHKDGVADTAPPRIHPEYKLGDALIEANYIINGERQKAYGSPEDSFNLIADLWYRYLVARGFTNAVLSNRDVCNLMMLMKIARDTQTQKRDNMVDIAGYAAIAADKFGDAYKKDKASD